MQGRISPSADTPKRISGCLGAGGVGGGIGSGGGGVSGLGATGTGVLRRALGRLYSGVLVLAALLALGGDEVLFDFEKPLESGRWSTWDARAEFAEGSLRLRTGGREAWPGVTLKAPGGKWDLSRFGRVTARVANRGTARIVVGLRVDNEGADGRRHCVFGELALPPGGRGTVAAAFRIRVPAPPGFEATGMHGGPGNPWGTIDPSAVTQIVFYVARAQGEHALEIDDVRASGEPPVRYPPAPRDFFPFIDELGQYIHREWPGKASPADLPRRAAEEAAALEREPGPREWNRWGGWAGGPALEATGFFRTAKHGGRWWLVDPDGRLFFSHGVNVVGPHGMTPVEDRSGWFRNWPSPDDPAWREFFRPASQVVHGHFRGRRPMCFDITAANLKRRYGAEWKARSEDLAHRRLRAWGLNTIGNWSDEGVRAGRRTPYVVAVHFAGPMLEGSGGHWQPFRDVFNPAFARDLRTALAAQAGSSAGDPWCIGYFVDNEIGWGDETSLAEAVLRAPPGQRAKRVFVEDLRGSYGEIGRLNAAWGTSHASWEALLAVREAPDPARAGPDLRAFAKKIAEAYFSQVRQAVREIAPRQLYLGCRFAEVHPLVAEVAARYADVVSFNVYRRSPAEFDFAGLQDAPVLIGEFHFGAFDRGPFSAGLVPVAGQQERGRAYREYLAAALRDPRIVGAHWFQYRDQPSTGRELDGEDYQIGLVDITDTPYPETVAAVRAVGASMYAERSR